MKLPGEQCRVFYDADDGVDVEPGDFLQTATGRTYLVDKVRVQQRGQNAGRHHLVVTVMPEGQYLDEDDVIHPIAWYSRGRRIPPPPERPAPLPDPVIPNQPGADDFAPLLYRVEAQIVDSEPKS